MRDRSDVTIVGISGSRRSGSITRVVVTEALAAAASTGAATELVDTATITLPSYDPDSPDAGAGADLREAVRAADGVLLGTPMYHGSYSSPIKAVLDYCGFDEFEDTIVGLLAVSEGSFPRPALEHLRSVCRALRAWVLPLQVGIPDASDHVENGQIVNGDLANRIAELGETLTAHADTGRFRNPVTQPHEAPGT